MVVPPFLLFAPINGKLNKPQKISLVQGVNWLTTRLITPQEKQWSLWECGSDLRLANRIAPLPPRTKVPIRCICCGFFVSRVLLTLAFSFICCFNLCFAALQETEIQGLQKTKRVSFIFSYKTEYRKFSLLDEKFSRFPLSIMCVNMFRSREQQQFLSRCVGEWSVFKHQSSCTEESVWQIREGNDVSSECLNVIWSCQSKMIIIFFNQVLSAKVVTNARSPGSKCYGLVTMSSSADVTRCISHLDCTELHGQKIFVVSYVLKQILGGLLKRDFFSSTVLFVKVPW